MEDDFLFDNQSIFDDPSIIIEEPNLQEQNQESESQNEELESIIKASHGYDTEYTMQITSELYAKEKGLDYEKSLKILSEAKEKVDEERALELEKAQDDTKKQEEISQTQENQNLADELLENAQNALDNVNNNSTLKGLVDNLEKQESLQKEIIATQEKLDDREERTPAERREYAQNALDNVNNNSTLKGLVDNLEKQESLQKEIIATQEKLENLEKSQTTQSQENQNQSSEANFQDDTDMENNPDYLKSKLEKLAEDFQKQQEVFEDSINSLAESKDIADLLKALYQLDRAYCNLKRTSLAIAEENKARRDEEAESLNLENTKKFIEKSVYALKDNYTLTKESLAMANKEKEFHQELNTMLNHNANPDKIMNLWEKINKETPDFKANYPQTTQKTEKFLKNQTQEQSQKQGAKR